jgi:uncharacterized protein YbjT (DUF2867 family)
MVVAIAGGGGKIGRQLAQLLAANGDSARSLIRRPEQADEIRAEGIEPVICDLEQASIDEVAEAIRSADAIVFAAGAGPGSGPERKETMDYGGAVKLIAAAKANGINRYVMVSSMGADPDASGDDTFSVYQRAKGRADADLAASGLDHTIVRPGRLTDDPGTGLVNAGEGVGRSEIPRADVAATLLAVLHEPGTAGLTFELVAGDTPIAEALARLPA